MAFESELGQENSRQNAETVKIGFVHSFGHKVDVPEKEARFSNTGVTNKEELEKVITEKKSVLEPGSFNGPLNNPPTLCHCVS